MDNSTLIKVVKNRWFKVGLIFILASVLFVIIYGRQALTTYLIYSRGGLQEPYLHITPELRILTPTHAKDCTVFSAFGYRIDIPLNRTPQFLNLDMGKGIFFVHQYGIIIHKPTDYPSNMYQYLKAGEKEDDVSHFKKILENKFDNNFDYVKSSFYSKPTLFAIFKPIEETTLLYYQLIDKWLYADAGEQTPEKIYYFEAENCKGFQIGDPSSLEKVTLWLFPDPDKEIKIHIQGVELGKVKQDYIDLIISTFKEAD